MPKTLSEGYTLAKKAEIWVNFDYDFTKTEQILAEDDNYGDIPSVQNFQVWERSLRERKDPITGFEANDIFESGIIFPNLILKDLIKIFYPSVVSLSSYSFTYHYNIKSLSPTSPIDFNNKSTYPKNCITSLWSNWTECSVKCGDGVQTRERHVTQHPINGGTECGITNEIRECTIPCTPEPKKLTGTYVGIGVGVACVCILIAIGVVAYVNWSSRKKAK